MTRSKNLGANPLEGDFTHPSLAGSNTNSSDPHLLGPLPPTLRFVNYCSAMLGLVLEVLLASLSCCYYILGATVKLFLPSKMFQKDISGQVLLLTGGGSGIGRLMCLRFARLGATVVTWDINEAGNRETVAMIEREGFRARAFTVDMSSREEIYEAARNTKEQVGPVQILVNNAGIVSGTSIMDTPDEKIVRTFSVNVLSHFWTIKSFLPDMIGCRQGHVVSVASMAGQTGTNKLVDYCASKFAAVGLDEALRVELAVQGHSDYIKTTVVCPYYISTGMFAGVYSKVLPILAPDFVADSVVSATLGNKEMMILPWWAGAILVLKHLLPSHGYMKVGTAFGINCSMDQFQGRETSE